jgi:hypothetical protein
VNFHPAYIDQANPASTRHTLSAARTPLLQPVQAPKSVKKYPGGYLKSPSIHADYQPVFVKTGGSICFQAKSIQMQRNNDA